MWDRAAQMTEYNNLCLPEICNKFHNNITNENWDYAGNIYLYTSDGTGMSPGYHQIKKNTHTKISSKAKWMEYQLIIFELFLWNVRIS